MTLDPSTQSVGESSDLFGVAVAEDAPLATNSSSFNLSSSSLRREASFKATSPQATASLRAEAAERKLASITSLRSTGAIKPDLRHADHSSSTSTPSTPPSQLLHLDHNGVPDGAEYLTRRLKSAIGQSITDSTCADGLKPDICNNTEQVRPSETDLVSSERVNQGHVSPESFSPFASIVLSGSHTVDGARQTNTGAWGRAALSSLGATFGFRSARPADGSSDESLEHSASSSESVFSGPSNFLNKMWGQNSEQSPSHKDKRERERKNESSATSASQELTGRSIEGGSSLPAEPTGPYQISRSRRSKKTATSEDNTRAHQKHPPHSSFAEHRENMDGQLGDEEGAFPARQYLIITSAGKPVYLSHLSRHRAARISSKAENISSDESCGTRNGNSARLQLSLDDAEEDAATARCAVVQALISNYASEGSQRLQEMSKQVLELPERSRIAFLLRPPLFLLAISRWGEAHSTLRLHLELLYLAILSLVSASQLQRHFDRSAAFDLRRLLGGTDDLMSSMVSRLQRKPTILFGAIQPLRLDPTLREDIGLALVPPKGDARPRDILYAMLISQQQVITLARPKRHKIHPADYHLLINTVYATKAIRESGTESWVPLCLPKFAPQGFVHAHISFIDADVERPNSLVDLALVLVTGNREGFSELSKWKSEIVEKLRHRDSLSRLTMALETFASYSADELAVAGLRHFVFKWRHNVLSTSPEFEEPYSHESDAQRRLLTLYSIAYDRIHKEREDERQKEEEEEMFRANGGFNNPPALKDGNSTSAVESSISTGNRSPDTTPTLPPFRPKSVLSGDAEAFIASKRVVKALSPSMHVIDSSSEAVFAWSTTNFELYVATSPHLSRTALVAAAKTIVKWVKSHEHTLFLVSTPVF